MTDTVCITARTDADLAQLCRQYKSMHDEMVALSDSIKPMMVGRKLVFCEGGEYFRLVTGTWGKCLDVEVVQVFKE